MCDNNAHSSDKHKSTPPPTFKVRNPFERALIDKLHTPICSPGMCKIYKNKPNSSFRWEIDQVCTLAPADIVICNSQYEPSPDPALDKITEEVTDRFFSQEMVMPSPFVESSKKMKPLLTSNENLHLAMDSEEKEPKIMKDATAQTVLTLPPKLPPELETILESYCTYTQEQNISLDYEVTANGSLRRKLLFEEHSDVDRYDDSEQTDDEVHVDSAPSVDYEAHSPVIFSPDLSRNLVAKGMKRTFGTPLKKSSGFPKPYRNKILDSVDIGEPCFSPIEFRGTPGSPKRSPRSRMDLKTPSSLASESISPVTKPMSSDDEKNNFTSPESEAMATCLNCISKTDSDKPYPCYCKSTPNKSILTRSASMKESPRRQRKSTGGTMGKRSLSMSSLNRSRSVQKLDFSMEMSIDGSLHDHDDSLRCHSELAGSESSVSPPTKNSWPNNTPSIQQLVEGDCVIQAKADKTDYKTDFDNQDTHYNRQETDYNRRETDYNRQETDYNRQETDYNRQETDYNRLENHIERHETDFDSHKTAYNDHHDIDKTPVKGKCKSVILTHGISNIRTQSPMNMSLDNSLDIEHDTLNMEDKKIDFDNIDLKFLTQPTTKVTNSVSFKRVDSGFNENTTFYASTASYYESSIKPSELTVTDMTKSCNSNALKEISNVNWMRVDSGFKDETSSDNVQFYPSSDLVKVPTKFCFTEASVAKENQENVFVDDFDKFLVRASAREEAMSISDIFADEMALNCNFSSTPSKNKARHNQ